MVAGCEIPHHLTYRFFPIIYRVSTIQVVQKIYGKHMEIYGKHMEIYGNMKYFFPTCLTEIFDIWIYMENIKGV